MKKHPVIEFLLDFFHFFFGGERCGARDRIAMRIAARYGMTEDYKMARRHNLNPLEALEDWDLISSEEERMLFYD
ncbi:MAG: hypothetical protein K6A93_10950 [Bacteroidaceae bacterium]|nr:hypothetical protein [Bacteroidaceae bacterium]